MANTCSYCKNRYSSRANLNRHLREKHGIDTNLTPTKNQIETCSFQCLEGCNVSFKNRLDLRSHIQSFHNIDPEEDEYIFDDIGEFNEWLNELEDTFGYKYVKNSQDLKSKLKETVFNCHRSEISKEIKGSRKRNQNDEGTCKIEIGCTSQIILTQEQGKYLVTYFKAHYGHFMEPQHPTVPKDVSIKVVSQLASVTPIKSIISDNRKSVEEKSKRSILLKNTDTNNINDSEINTKAVRKSISKTKSKDDWQDHRNSDAEEKEACTKERKKQKVLNLVCFKSQEDDSQSRHKEIKQNIQKEILKLMKNIETEKSMVVLTHVLETLRSLNEIATSK